MWQQNCCFILPIYIYDLSLDEWIQFNALKLLVKTLTNNADESVKNLTNKYLLELSKYFKNKINW